MPDMPISECEKPFAIRKATADPRTPPRAARQVLLIAYKACADLTGKGAFFVITVFAARLDALGGRGFRHPTPSRACRRARSGWRRTGPDPLAARQAGDRGDLDCDGRCRRRVGGLGMAGPGTGDGAAVGGVRVRRAGR